MVAMTKPTSPPKPRGRPKLEGALSVAERAARYRAKKAAALAALKRDATAIKPMAVGRLEGKIILLNIELLKKADELDAAWAKVAELEKEIASLKGVTPRKSTKKGRI